MQTHLFQLALAMASVQSSPLLGIHAYLSFNRITGEGNLRIENSGQRDAVLCNWPGAFEVSVQTNKGVRVPSSNWRYVDSVNNPMPYDWVVLRQGQAFETQVVALKFGRPYRNIPKAYRVWVEVSKTAAAFDLPEHCKGHHFSVVRSFGRIFSRENMDRAPKRESRNDAPPLQW